VFTKPIGAPLANANRAVGDPHFGHTTAVSISEFPHAEQKLFAAKLLNAILPNPLNLIIVLVAFWKRGIQRTFLNLLGVSESALHPNTLKALLQFPD
jgi:hypothetical protein